MLFSEPPVIVSRSLILAFLMILGCNGCKRGGSSEPEATCFSPPGWLGSGETFLRRESSASDVLLIKRPRGTNLRGSDTRKAIGTDADSFYRYDPRLGNIGPVTRKEWDKSAEEVIDCGTNFDYSMPRHRAVVIRATRQFEIGSKVVPTAGEVPLKCVTPPDADLTAILSGDAPDKGAFLPFLSSTVCTGQHYHQTFSRASATQVGETERIPFVSADKPISMCWSPDQQYVLYCTGGSVCIIPVIAGRDQKP